MSLARYGNILSMAFGKVSTSVMARETIETNANTLGSLKFSNICHRRFATGFWSRFEPKRSNHGGSFRMQPAASLLLVMAVLVEGCTMKGGTASPNTNSPQAAVSPSSIDFGDQDIGTTSNPLTVTLTNNGNADLVVSGVSPSPSQFAAAGPSSATITAGKQVVYTVTFDPSVAQVYSGALSFTITPSVSAGPVSLNGKGRKRISISPTSLSFGNQTVNTTSTPQSVTVTNTGSSSLVINSAASSPSQFVLPGVTPTTGGPGGNAVYTVTFTPTAAQFYSGSVAFNTNASAVASTVPESGTGTSSPSTTICGQLGDQSVHIPPNYNLFVPPIKGGSYVDPQYGCTVVRLTGGPSEFGVPAHHYYGTLSSFSADDSKIMLFLDNGSPAIVDTSSNVVVSASNMPASNTNNYPWDPFNPAVFYYTNGNQFFKGTLSGNTVAGASLHTFTGFSSCMIPARNDAPADATTF